MNESIIMIYQLSKNKNTLNAAVNGMLYLFALLTTKKFSYEHRLIEFCIFFIVIAIPHMIVYL